MYSEGRGVLGQRSGWLVRNPLFEEAQQNRTIFNSGAISAPNFTNGRTQESETNATENIEKEKPPPEKEAANSTKNCYTILENQALEISTAHGYPLIFKAKTWFGKLMWALIFLVATGAFVRQAYVLMDRYLEFSVSVELAVVTQATLDFPAVTVCNTNKVRRSAIAHSKHKQVLTVDDNTPTAYKVPCSSIDFDCSDGAECTKSFLLCDGIRHCSDGSDEIGCTYGDCGDNQFMCKNGSKYGTCIDKDLQCDNTIHCYDAEDELDCACTADQFKCGSGPCVPRTKLCDDANDCMDSSDEQPTLCDQELLQKEGWKCGDTLVFIPQMFVCDQYRDCPLGNDERDEACTQDGNNVVCGPDQLSCEDVDSDNLFYTRCIDATSICDGIDDSCIDFADESREYCPDDKMPPRVLGCPTGSNTEFNFIMNTGVDTAIVTWDEITAMDNFGSDSDNLNVKEDVHYISNPCNWEPNVNVDDVRLPVELSSGDSYHQGYYAVTYTFTDLAGNIAFCSFNFHVCPASEIINITICPEDIRKRITMSKIADGSASVTWMRPRATLTTVEGTVELEAQLLHPTDEAFIQPSPDEVTWVSASEGELFVQYRFSTELCRFYITVISVDRDIPDIVFCPVSVLLPYYNPWVSGRIYYHWELAKFTDASQFSVNHNREHFSDLFYPGVTTIIALARDEYDNVNTCTFDVQVIDDEPPDVICPYDITQTDVPPDVTGRFLTWENPIYSDLSTKSGGEIYSSLSHEKNSFFPLQTTHVTYRYWDESGNEGTCSFNITLIQDPTKSVPMFNCTSGQVIPMWKTCNNIPDCEDGDDEQICGTSTVICDAYSRPCRDGSEKTNCIRNQYECNFVKHCADGGDEMYCDFPDDCGDNYFQCKSSRVCLHRYALCNGVWDCIDGTDEENCHDETATQESPLIKDWHLKYSESLSTNDVDIKEMVLQFEENVYRGREFHRVKGDDPPDWNTFVSFSSTPDFSDLTDALLLNREEIAQYGHQVDDLILQCTYDELQCNKSNIIRFVDDQYGNCFTFNYVNDSNKQPIQSTRAGSINGLKMTLFLEQSEYISIFGREAGVRVSIHSADTISLPADDGITIRPGTVSSIGLRYENVSRLGGRYGKCTPDDAVWQDLRDGEMVTINNKQFDERYNRKRCLRTCLYVNIYQRCGCSDTIQLNGRRCRILNATEDLCRQYIRYLHDNNLLDCNCEQACNDRYFIKTVSQSVWPSDIYRRHLLRTIHSITDKTIDINDEDSVSKNLARLEVFFEELTYAVTKDVPAYLPESLFSDIGGTAGLYIGYSFITVCEFAAVALVLLRYICTKNRAQGIPGQRQQQDRGSVNINLTPRGNSRGDHNDARPVEFNYEIKY